jgi:hypothetical protein
VGEDGFLLKIKLGHYATQLQVGVNAGYLQGGSNAFSSSIRPLGFLLAWPLTHHVTIKAYWQLFFKFPPPLLSKSYLSH